jgi:hypothetical protein
VSKPLTLLSEWWRERGGGDFQKLIVHADHGRLHKATVSHQFMAQNAMEIGANHPYSLAIALSRFYLFGDVEGRLTGESFETGERLLSAVDGI